MTPAARVFFDGILTEPRLAHPEGIAVHPDGSVWCGGEQGQVFRIEADGSRIEQVASTGGFCLGLAFDRHLDLYVCDLKHSAVMQLDAHSGQIEVFADGAAGRRLRIPNYPAFDDRGRLYVSDSHGFKEPGPGIFRFQPDGTGELWCAEDLDFANGLAFAPDFRYLYVAETFSRRVSRLSIQADGSAGPRETFAELGGSLPDGLAFDVEASLYVGCYEPSQILRITPAGRREVLLADPEAHLLCHPTNLAFRGHTLRACNFGRWHVTEMVMSVEGVGLPPATADAAPDR